ncbi:MAG: gamma-glutamyltransferase [Hyphomicrobiales bacterium]|nr:gamma-glutamyltransferase [Hyphomicrobiales bacterium]
MDETPVFSHAAVVAPHARAARVGRDLLAQGANAIEAMVGMAATVAVVYPHMNGPGGDAFWMVRERGGRVRCLEACGFAGAGATLAAYRARGHEDAPPPRGVEAVVTTPGAVAGWSLALELSRALGGRMDARHLLADSIAAARDGFPIADAESRCLPAEIDDLRDMPGFASTYLEGGQAPKPGAVRRFPALAGTLERLAHAGLDDFYRGDVARELAADLERLDAAVTRADLVRTRARETRPLSLALEGARLHNSPPPTQGLASLALLGIHRRLAIRPGDDFAWTHGMVEAAKRALLLREALCHEPALDDGDPADALTDAALAREAAAIDMRRAARWPGRRRDSGGTVWMGAIDGTGLAVSYIQSIYWEYGSGIVSPSTGVLMSNRGVAFSLDPASKRALAPGRRPFHTLNPPLAEWANGDVLAYGSMGGDGQPQFQAQVFARIVRGGGLAAALDAPRFRFGRDWGEVDATLKLEGRIDDALARRLAEAGHEVVRVEAPYADAFGHAGALRRRARDGAIEAAHDPRSDGAAMGL